MTQPHAKPESQTDVREILLVILVAACALVVRKSLASWDHDLSWMAFGAVLLGGQQLVLVGRRGLLKTSPSRSVLQIAFGVAIGALIGYVLK